MIFSGKEKLNSIALYKQDGPRVHKLFKNSVCTIWLAWLVKFFCRIFLFCSSFFIYRLFVEHIYCECLPPDLQKLSEITGLLNIFNWKWSQCARKVSPGVLIKIDLVICLQEFELNVFMLLHVRIAGIQLRSQKKKSRVSQIA